jgi:hypothetical protein
LEIKINREIREYTEAMYFGLSLRQFICAVLACGAAVGLYFLLRPIWGWKPSVGCACWERLPLRPLVLSNITE